LQKIKSQSQKNEIVTLNKILKRETEIILREAMAQENSLFLTSRS
jgi:hypothetical protein